MNIEKIKEYASENGLSEKRIAELVALLHPDEKGELSIIEGMEAMAAVAEVVRAREYTKTMVESIRASRKQHEEWYGKQG